MKAKKVLALVLTIALCLSLAPAAFAEETTEASPAAASMEKLRGAIKTAATAELTEKMEGVKELNKEAYDAKKAIIDEYLAGMKEDFAEMKAANETYYNAFKTASKVVLDKQAADAAALLTKWTEYFAELKADNENNYAEDKAEAQQAVADEVAEAKEASAEYGELVYDVLDEMVDEIVAALAE